eukprot:1192691-Prorocentrum_minimum.AAC.1
MIWVGYEVQRPATFWPGPWRLRDIGLGLEARFKATPQSYAGINTLRTTTLVKTPTKAPMYKDEPNNAETDQYNLLQNPARFNRCNTRQARAHQPSSRSHAWHKHVGGLAVGALHHRVLHREFRSGAESECLAGDRLLGRRELRENNATTTTAPLASAKKAYRAVEENGLVSIETTAEVALRHASNQCVGVTSRVHFWYSETRS